MSLNPKIEKLKLQGTEYDISVDKDWETNEANSINYIKNRTHYFMRILDNVVSSVMLPLNGQRIITGADIGAGDGGAADSAAEQEPIGTSAENYLFTTILNMTDIEAMHNLENTGLTAQLVVYNSDNIPIETHLVRLASESIFEYNISTNIRVQWDGSASSDKLLKICRLGNLAGDIRVDAYVGKTYEINPAYIPIDNNTLNINSSGKLEAISKAPSKDEIDELMAHIRNSSCAHNYNEWQILDSAFSKEVQNDFSISDSQAQALILNKKVRRFRTCSICGNKQYSLSSLEEVFN